MLEVLNNNWIVNKLVKNDLFIILIENVNVFVESVCNEAEGYKKGTIIVKTRKSRWTEFATFHDTPWSCVII